MHTKDLTWGITLLVLAVVAFYMASSFPTLPKQNVGAGTFPILVSVLLGLCGGFMTISALAGNRSRQASATNIDDRLHITPRKLTSLLLLLAVPVCCAYLSESFGFTLAATLPTSLLMWTLRGGQLLQSAAISLAFCSFVFVVFTKALLVPLEYGPLGTIIGI